MTGSRGQSDEEYEAAEAMRASDSRVVHILYPEDFTGESATTTQTLKDYAAMPNVRAIIVTQAVNGTTEAFQSISESNPDILLFAGVPAEDTTELCKYADLVMNTDGTAVGAQVANQASAWGCDVVVHCSFARHMAYDSIQAVHNTMKSTAEAKGMTFVDYTCEDPTATSLASARQALKDGVADLMANTYAGKKVCFYVTNCGLQPALQQAVLANANAYYALPCCPSPYHGFDEAFGLTMSYDNPTGALHTLAAYLAANNAAGRFSTWKIPANMAIVKAFVLYAQDYIDGTITETNSRTGMSSCLASAAGSSVSISGEGNLIEFALSPVDMNDYISAD